MRHLLLGQPAWYWLLVAFTVVFFRMTYLSMRREAARSARALARASERHARAAEDFYWRFYRESELQAAARITARKYAYRIRELLDERDERQTALRAVT